MTLQSEPLAHKADPRAFDTPNATELDAAWARLLPLGIDAVPHLIVAYRLVRSWQGRAAAVLHATRFSRRSELAFQLGLEALRDRSSHVRSRACGLLAYSLRTEAEGRLLLLLSHADRVTRHDAEAAMAAIRDQNHHLFKDRDRTGQIFWIVDAADIPDP